MASWLIVWIVVAMFGWRAVNDHFRTEWMQKRLVMDQELQQANNDLTNQVNLIAQDFRRKSREADTRRKAELDAAWGGSAAAAFKNPAFNLREALLHAAEAAAPTNTLVTVEVDRFSEFVVTIESREMISTNQMIATARKLMPLAKEYLAGLRFSQRGALVAELDRQDIEFIGDWERVPDQRIVMLLPRESKSRVAEDPAAIERLRDEQRIAQALAATPELRDKVEEADRNFRQSVQNAYDELRLTLESLQKATAFGDVRTMRDINERDQQLRAGIEHADRARAFWNDPAAEWGKILNANGVGGDLRETLVKSFGAIFRTDPKRTASVLEALRGMVESSRYLMGMLTRETDKWRFSSEGIVFTKEDFARRFERVQAQLREDSQATETALRRWQEAVGP
jgi:hypothetical protein